MLLQVLASRESLDVCRVLLSTSLSMQLNVEAHTGYDIIQLQVHQHPLEGFIALSTNLAGRSRLDEVADHCIFVRHHKPLVMMIGNSKLTVFPND